MKRILIFSLAVMLLGQLSYGQNFFSWGIKGGANITNFNTNLSDFTTLDLNINVMDFDPNELDPTVTINPTDFVLAQSDANIGFHVGAFARIKLLGLFIQPELYFSSSTNTLTVADVTGVDPNYEALLQDYALNQTYSKLDFPILVGVKLGPLRINAGPVGSYMFSSKSDLESFFTDYEDITTKATFGYQAGIGLDLFKVICLDVRYEGSLSKYGEGTTVGGQEITFDSRPSQIIGSIAIMF